MSFVFVVDQQRRPLDPVPPGRARFLLKAGHAAVLRRYPFTLILHEAKPDTTPQPLRLKIDPGSKTTGLALVNDETGQVVWAAELAHRGQQVKERLDQRRQCRRGRRNRHTRYRAPRFNNRTRPKGWLPPSLVSRLDNILTWVARLRRVAPIADLSQELVKFDLQVLENPDITGIAYQQGTLAGYEIREYLLEKWHRTCAYCGKRDTPFEVDHIIPRSRRGTSNRIGNLALACHECNHAKGNQTAIEFGHPEVQTQAARPLKDAAAVNASRWALYAKLHNTGLPVETGTGGRTKWNRTQRDLPKTHWLDAACVGVSTPATVSIQQVFPVKITAVGRQRRQMCLVDKYGFPRTKAKEHRVIQGFQTGDIVVAVVPSGKRTGKYQGKVAVKANGQFSIATTTGTVPDIAARYCRKLHRSDGYSYQKGDRAFLPIP